MSRIGTMALAAMALAVCAPLAAQESGSIKGTVIRNDAAGVGGVRVVINESGDVATTSASGAFSFRGIAPGTYSLALTLGSNSATEEGVTVTAGETTTVAKSVDWETSFIDTITVFSASRREERIVDAPASITAFSEEEIESKAVTGQLAKVIEFAPGIEVNQSGIYDFNINARGFNSSLNRRVQTLIDGREPSIPFLGNTDWLSLAAMHDVQSMELVRGPSSALYGANAFNGVLNVITKSAADSVGGRLTLTGGEQSTLKTDLLWGAELGSDWYLKLLGSYTEGEDYYVPRVGTTEYPGLPTEFASGTNEYDNSTVTLRFDKAFDNGGLLSVESSAYEGNGGTVVTGIGRVQVGNVDRQWSRVNLSTEHFNLLAFHNGRESPDQSALASGGRIFLDSTQDKIEVQANTTFNGGKGRLVGGLSYKEEDIDTVDSAGFQTLVFAPVTHDFSAAFAQVDFDLGDRVKLVLAGRADESSLHDSQFSPKAALVWGLDDRNTLRLSYNEAFQVPNYSEFFLDAPTAFPTPAGPIPAIDLRGIEAGLCAPFGVVCGFGAPTRVRALGNAGLTVEEVTSIELGYSGILNDKVFLTIDYYSNELENFITDLTPNAFGAVNPNFGPYTPPSNHPAPALLLATLQASLPATVFPFLSNNVDGTPIFALASYANAGQVDTQGVDLGLSYYISPWWQFDFSYSWFDFDIKETGGFATSNLLPNAPEGKASIGLTHSGERIGWSIKGRWVDDFDWAAGSFVGPVPSYESFAADFHFDASNVITVGATVSNLFDDEHYQSFGGDLLARRALGYVAFNW